MAATNLYSYIVVWNVNNNLRDYQLWIRSTTLPQRDFGRNIQNRQPLSPFR